MFYKVLNDEDAKNLFVVKKTGRDISAAQKNFWTYKGSSVSDSNIVFQIAKKCVPEKCYGCFIINQFVTEINGRRLGRNGVMIYHIFYIDDKNVIKYVKLNSKNEIVTSEILKETAEVNEFANFEASNSLAIAHFISEASGRFQEEIKNKIENEILLSDKEKEEVARVYSLKDEEKIDENNIGDTIVLENVRVDTETKEYGYGYNRNVTNYYVFRGQVRGFANRAKINMTFLAVKKSFELLDIEYTTDERKMIEMMSGKNIILEGNFSLYGNTVIGRGVKHLAFIK